MQHTYYIIQASGEAVFHDRGSKFLAYTFRVKNIHEIKAACQSLKTLHPKAAHHCFAWRLGFDKTHYRANDDGEPSGSAGRPILGQIDSLQLTRVLVVVVRYFGGTLLGVPGLINAYKTAAQLALQQSGIVEEQRKSGFRLQFDYTLMNVVMQVIKANHLDIVQQSMALFCEMEVMINLSDQGKIIEKFETISGVNIEAIPEYDQ